MKSRNVYTRFYHSSVLQTLSHYKTLSINSVVGDGRKHLPEISPSSRDHSHGAQLCQCESPLHCTIAFYYWYYRLYTLFLYSKLLVLLRRRYPHRSTNSYLNVYISVAVCFKEDYEGLTSYMVHDLNCQFELSHHCSVLSGIQCQQQTKIRVSREVQGTCPQWCNVLKQYVFMQMISVWKIFAQELFDYTCRLIFTYSTTINKRSLILWSSCSP